MNVLTRSLRHENFKLYSTGKNEKPRLTEVSTSFRGLIHYAHIRLSNFHLINIRCGNKINNKFIMYYVQKFSSEKGIYRIYIE